MTNHSQESSTRDERVDEAILAYLEAVDAGRPPEPAAFLARYPEIADELRAYFADQDHISRATHEWRQPRGARRNGVTTLAGADSAIATVSTALPGSIGGYRPLRLLGAGGMGRVYEAADASGRRFALKLISPNFAESPTTLERFRQEGRLASRIAHPRCVFVLAADEEAGQPYIVMELMSGATLKDLVEQNGPLTPNDAIAKTLDIIEGLEEAHRAGVIHRDIKPANCYVEPDGRVKIGDFGLSRSLSEQMHLTRTGAFVGTPLFASPEQLKGERLDVRTDIYSLAATLYYLLTGRAPFQHASGASVIARVVTEPPPSPRTLRPEISTALEQVVLRGLERQREKRLQSLEEFREALAALLPRKLSIAGLGLRVGAYLLDLLPLQIVTQIIVIVTAKETIEVNVAAVLASLAMLFLYFWLTEGLWGASLGKRLVRLRVLPADGQGRLGMGKTFVRTLVFLATSGSVIDLCLYTWVTITPSIQLGILSLTGSVASILLRMSTMRARNGYRGLHEMLSGSRVVQLPFPARRGASARWRALMDAAEQTTVDGAAPADGRPEDAVLPTQFGTYNVCRVMQWQPASRVLLGEEQSLGRSAWLVLRPASETSLATKRTDLARSTRLRWLGEGVAEDWRWDAFIAPAGISLPEAVRVGGPFSWTEGRCLLEGLAGEVAAACADGTLPATLEVDQVWVSGPGRVQLLDAALSPNPPAAELSTENAPQRALHFLAAVARLALDRGKRPSSGVVRAPIPLHARRILDKLTGAAPAYQELSELQHDLASTAERPTEVTPSLRAIHVGISLCFTVGALFAMVVWSRMGATVQLMHLDQALLRSQVLRQVVQDEELGPRFLQSVPHERRLGDVERLVTRLSAQEAEDHERLATCFHSLGWTEFFYMQVPQVCLRQRIGVSDERLVLEPVAGDKFQVDVRRPDLPAFPVVVGLIDRTAPVKTDDLLKAAERAQNESPDRDVGERRRALLSVAINVGFFPLTWLVVAFVFRGGVSLRIASLALVRSDGRLARRWQSVWRAMLVWLPVVALFLAVGWVDLFAPESVWLVPILHATVLGMLALYLFVALRFPRRGLHDRLAGTYLVPR